MLLNNISLISFIRRPEYSLTRGFLTPDYVGLMRFEIAILLRSLFGSHSFGGTWNVFIGTSERVREIHFRFN